MAAAIKPLVSPAKWNRASEPATSIFPLGSDAAHFMKTARNESTCEFALQGECRVEVRSKNPGLAWRR
jgi:hypothetical protein